MLCSNFVKFGRRESGNGRNCALFIRQKRIKFRLPLKLSLLRGWRPKSARASPPTMYSECARFHPNRFTFGGVTAERVNTAKSRRKVNPIFDWSLASSRIKIPIATAGSRDVAMVTDLWPMLAKIDTPHLHSVRWHSTSDGNIATPIVALTSTMIPLRLLKIWSCNQ